MIVTHCGLCGSANLTTALSLGSSPPACATTEETFPLELLGCGNCGLIQLSVIVKPELVFPPEYPYSSGNSRQMHADFVEIAASVKKWLGSLSSEDLIVDIGANDGTLLHNFAGCRTVGVEPTEQAARIKGPSYQEFFTEDLAKRIREEHGPAKVITACNVLAHVADIHDTMRGITHLLADDGVLVAENHNLASVVNGQWDTVYHEHLRFFDRNSFDNLLRRHVLAEQTFQRIPTHGGSFRVLATKGPRYDFAKLADSAARVRYVLGERTREPVWGIGATARATTIINYCGLDVENVSCVCEVAGSDKIGRFIPGTRIPVVDEAELFEKQPPAAILFSWHLADSILAKLRLNGYGGEVIIPLPKVHSR